MVIEIEKSDSEKTISATPTRKAKGVIISSLRKKKMKQEEEPEVKVKEEEKKPKKDEKGKEKEIMMFKTVVPGRIYDMKEVREKG